MTLRPATSPARARGITRIGGMLYGGDYSPVQWPEEVWLEDARLMREAGVNLVSLGVFAWSRLEVAPREFDFGWLDRVIDMLHAHSVSVNLATPTASPPPWLVRRHPDILPVTAVGTTLWHGSRRHYCPHSPAYREAAVRITTALADRYGAHPALAMWHIDNEYACHVTECFCERSAAAFRLWLRERHGSIEGLNDAWGSAFWSQTYGDWEEIEPPRATPTFVNPTQLLDWRRFWSEAWLACLRDQASVLRAVTPDVPITTNFMGFHGPLDYWAWSPEEDVVSNDSYPDMADPDWMVGAAMAYDLMRSLGSGRPWILMEQAPAHVNWRDRNVTKRPGVMRLGSYQAIARGADGVMFFQWRASRAGAEKHHSGMVPHAGTTSRTWREIAALGQELRRCDELIGSQVPADVAILFDWENLWALGAGPLPSSAIRLLPQIKAFYTPFHARQVTVDFAHPEDDLSKYRLVIAPHLYMTSDIAAGNLIEYVRTGGTLLMSFFSGIVDTNDHVRVGGYPNQFTQMLGLRVEEFAPHAEGQTTSILTRDGSRFTGALWSDVIDPAGATPVATYADDFYAGRAAITRHAYGDGTAFYLGTMPDEVGMSWLTELICRTGRVARMAESPYGVEAVQRRDASHTWLFLLNHTSEPADVPLAATGVELLSGEPTGDSVRVAAMDVAVVRTTAPATQSRTRENVSSREAGTSRSTSAAGDPT
jgi:beta-galactosidase